MNRKMKNSYRRRVTIGCLVRSPRLFSRSAMRGFAFALGFAMLQSGVASAQGFGSTEGYLSLPVETVTVTIAHPSGDQALNDRITDAVRKSLALYPGERFQQDHATFAISRSLIWPYRYSVPGRMRDDSLERRRKMPKKRLGAEQIGMHPVRHAG